MDPLLARSALGLIAVALLVSACGSANVVAAPAAVPVGAPTEVAPNRLSALSLEALDAAGTTVREPSAAVRQSARITADEAGRVAGRRFAGVIGGVRAPDEQELVVATVASYGTLKDPQNPRSKVDLLVDDRLCWVTVFTGVAMPRSGGPVPPTTASPAERAEWSRERSATAIGRVLVLVDAKTGRYLRASTY